MSPMLPKALERGDTIGLVGPAGPWQEEALRKGVQILSDLGFQSTIPRNLQDQQGYLAGSDFHRLETFTEVWKNPEVKAVMAVRGGYGSLRILNEIDYDLIRSYPKILVGFSDVTALLSAIVKKTGLTTFHGPMLTTLEISDRESVHHLFSTLCSQTPQPLKPANLEILRPGSARGVLLGGNLTTLAHLISTPFELTWQDKILFIEDIGEAQYRLDRMLTHLSLAGRLDNIAGVILGSFINCGDQEQLWHRVLELFKQDIPIWANFPTGHGARNMTMPIGANVEMDSSMGSLTYTSPVLS